MQTKTHSLIESVTNILIGYLVAVASQLVIFPMFGIFIPLQDNLLIGAFFTVISLARSYILRRAFNHHTAKQHDERCETRASASDEFKFLLVPEQAHCGSTRKRVRGPCINTGVKAYARSIVDTVVKGQATVIPNGGYDENILRKMLTTVAKEKGVAGAKITAMGGELLFYCDA